MESFIIKVFIKNYLKQPFKFAMAKHILKKLLNKFKEASIYKTLFEMLAAVYMHYRKTSKKKIEHFRDHINHVLSFTLLPTINCLLAICIVCDRKCDERYAWAYVIELIGIECGLLSRVSQKFVSTKWRIYKSN